jgi:hypothetical protein
VPIMNHSSISIRIVACGCEFMLDWRQVQIKGGRLSHVRVFNPPSL